jgi:VWFA-related protein
MKRQFIIVLIATSIAAQTPAPPPSGGKTEVAASSTEGEVALDLVVRDKGGRLIRDLRPEEIQLSDGGKPAKIRSVHLSGASEHAARENRPHQAIVLMFDALGRDSAIFAREGAMEVARGAAEADALVAVVCVGSRLGILQPFTGDKDALKKSIEIATVSATHRDVEITKAEEGLRRMPVQAGAAGGAPPAQLLLEAVSSSELAARDQKAKPAMASMLGLAKALAKLPGRKTIVYFSGGLQLSTSEATVFQSLVSESNLARVSLYAVDASATAVQASAQAMLAVASVTSNIRATGIAAGGPAPRAHSGDDVQSYPHPIEHQYGDVSDGMPTGTQDALRELSVSTGGIFVKSDLETKRKLRRIPEDAANYYEVVYTPKEEPQPGQFRNVGVQMTRPDLKVQSRSGYFAGSTSVAQFGAFEGPLAKAILEKGGQLDPWIRVKAFELRPGAKTVTGEVVVEIPLSRLHIQEISSEKVMRLHFSVLALILDESGREIARCSEDVPQRVAIEAKERMLQEVYTFARPFTAPPGKYQVEVGIQDRLADKIALVHTTFEAHAANAPAVSEAILARRLEAAPSAADLDDPMLYGAKRVVPDLHPVITEEHDDTLPLFLILYPDPAVKTEPELTVQVVGSVTSFKETKLALGKTEGRSAIPYVVDIPVKNLSPGNYKVRASFTQGGAPIQREVDFLVPGEPKPIAPAESATAKPEAPAPVAVAAVRPGAAVSRPSEKDQASMLAGARQRALAYSQSLPNFTCIESTQRSVARPGTQDWKPKDTLSELVRYVDGQEDRKLIEINGAPTTGDRSSLQGTLSSGEFGHLLKVVFGERAHATFTWKETAFLDGVRCEVFTSQVDRKHSGYSIATNGGQWGIDVAYIASVYIDAATFNIRRVKLEAIDIPPEFPIRASSFSVDYAYVRAGDADFLLPTSGAVELQQSRRVLVRNEVQFRDYHRLGSQTSIRYQGF